MRETDKPIRILHVVTYMGRGGLETMLMNYYRNIDRYKVQFDFLTHRDFEADYDQEIEELGGKIYHIPRLNPFSPSYLRQLDQFFREHRGYTIVHSHLDCMAGIPLKYAQRNGVPIRIAHAHNSNQARDKNYVLKLYFKHNITKYATHLFACSREAGRWIFGTDKFEILNNSIDAEQYIYNENVRNKVRREFGIGQSTLVLGHVGRFSAQKNHKFLIDVFKKVVEMHSDSVLFLAGDGELQYEIRDKVQKEKLENKVIFAGVRNDIPRLLQAMDVFVLPSLFEGLPVVLIEAQAAGLPCLISERVSDESEKTVGLIQKLNLDSGAEKWAEGVLRSIGMKRENRLTEIREAGFDIKKSAEELQQFYMNVYPQ